MQPSPRGAQGELARGGGGSAGAQSMLCAGPLPAGPAKDVDTECSHRSHGRSHRADPAVCLCLGICRRECVALAH